MFQSNLCDAKSNEKLEIKYQIIYNVVFCVPNVAAIYKLSETICVFGN